MHESAMNYGKLFFEKYCQGDFSGKIIIDVGSLNVNGSLKNFCPAGSTYIGVDFCEGSGVDVVIDDPYNLPFEDNTADVIVCSSVFEHSDFFWLLYLECLRILKPSGLLYLNCPSNGMVHRYPIDSWRFYPDSGLSLAKWGKFNSFAVCLLESFVGDKQGSIKSDGIWNDFVAVFVKDQKFSLTYPHRIQDVEGKFYHGCVSEEETNTPQLGHVPDYELLMWLLQTNELLTTSLNAQNLTIAAQASQIADNCNAIASMQNSRSWRLTKPMRFIKKSLMTTCTLAYKSMDVIWRSAIRPTYRKDVIKRYLTARQLIDDRTSAIPVVQFDTTQESYTEYKHNPSIDPSVKIIAFYLPQFHPFPENDEWWGKGFTEWYNVGRAHQNYAGHYQPHCPIHNGYYDLRVPSIMEEQASLAKQYGVHGFSYYFYWFAGKILMDTPLEMMLANPSVDIPFCLTWANENWTRRWDGSENDVLIAQNHSKEDSIAFIQHLVKYFNDPRYIRIDNKPVLIIYRASIIPEMRDIAALWREEIKKYGFPDLYLICAQSFDVREPEKYGLDAAVEFPPHATSCHDISEELQITNPDFKGYVYSYDKVVSNAIQKAEPDYKIFRTAMLSWDNTARKQNHAHSFHGFSLMRYKQWLSAMCANVSRSNKYEEQEKIVFINAWNEWAEGSHLEPDRKYGYGYLQATYDVISHYDKKLLPTMVPRQPEKKNDYAVILHVHYCEVWPDIRSKLESCRSLGFDLFVTTTNKDSIPLILADYPDAHVELHENRGRDIFPFTKTIEHISKCNYRAVCKLHTKRSVYRVDGDLLRDQLLNSLIGDEKKIIDIVNRFAVDKSLGMVVPADFLMAHNYENMESNQQTVAEASRILNINFQYDIFPAGSMFWFKPEALRDLNKFKSSDFDVEHGLADGTLPHGIERIFCLLAKKSGYRVETC